MKTVFAVDPGNVESAYAILRLDGDLLELHDFAKVENDVLLYKARNTASFPVAIEMIASYGMPVGKEVFETCVFIGRLREAMSDLDVRYVYRRDVKLYLCDTPRAKDANVRQALISRYAQHDFKNGRGTKKAPDVFYGVKADVWAAIAVGVTYLGEQSEKAV